MAHQHFSKKARKSWRYHLSCCWIKRIHKPLIVCSLTRCLARKSSTSICQEVLAHTQDCKHLAFLSALKILGRVFLHDAVGHEKHQQNRARRQSCETKAEKATYPSSAIVIRTRFILYKVHLDLFICLVMLLFALFLQPMNQNHRICHAVCVTRSANFPDDSSIWALNVSYQDQQSIKM